MRTKGIRSAAFLSISMLALTSAGASAETLQSIGTNNALVTFNSTTPGTVTSAPLTGIGPNQVIRGIDYRPASPRLLYGISNTGQLYSINSRTAAATAIGTPSFPPISAIGFDFNPTVDRIRVITANRQDVRVVPDTGALAATDGTLAYATTDANAGQIPVAAGAAYTNSFAGATSTTLYVIDTRGGLAPARLVTQGNATVGPNTGTLFTVGSTGVTSRDTVGFDIANTGNAFATFTNTTTGVTSLYTVNLTTGAATLVGALSGNTTYDGLAVQLAPFQSFGATANQAAVGGVLDNFVGLPSGDTLSLFNAIDSQFATPGAQSAALQALSPAAYSNLPELSLNAIETQETNILRYTRDLRGNADMPDGTTATLDEAGRVGAWLVGGTRNGRIDPAADRFRTEVDEYHVLGGADFRLNAKTAIGVFGGYSQTDARLTPFSERGRLESLFAGGYGTVGVGPLYVDAWGSYTDLDWQLNRRVSIGSFSATPSAQTSGRIWAAGAATGLSFALGGLELEPFAAVRYADIRIDGFNETGGSAAALTVGGFNRTSIRTNLGARLGGKFEAVGAIVRPQIRGGWYHEFRDNPQTINAAFLNGAIGSAFAFTTTPLSPEYFNAGASLSIGGKGPLSMVADFDRQFDDDRSIDSFTIGARLAF